MPVRRAASSTDRPAEERNSLIPADSVSSAGSIWKCQLLRCHILLAAERHYLGGANEKCLHLAPWLTWPTESCAGNETYCSCKHLILHE